MGKECSREECKEGREGILKTNIKQINKRGGGKKVEKLNAPHSGRVHAYTQRKSL